MNRKDKFSLKYEGTGLVDGSIGVEDLVSGLTGLVKVAEIVASAGNMKDVNLKVEGFEKGSFNVILDFVETHPVLFHSVVPIIVATIPALAYYFKKGETEKNISPQVETIIKIVRSDQKKLERARKAYYEIVKPLKSEGISSVSFGNISQPHEIADQNDVDSFIENLYIEEPESTIHKSIVLNGQIRALDKKTLNGKFIDDKNNTYSISLIMENPENYFELFDKDNVQITGVATIDKNSNEIKKIEVEKTRLTVSQYILALDKSS